jgi:hypothetical protein
MGNVSNHGSASKALFFALFFSLIAASHADEISCKRQKYDPEFPAALLGKYEIVGRMPDSNATYGGTLEISDGKTAYTLKRIVNGNVTSGEAWIETCGTDSSRGVKVLGFKYTKGKVLLEGHCFPGSDLENGMFLSCYSNVAGVKNERPGLESMFPRNDF